MMTVNSGLLFSTCPYVSAQAVHMLHLHGCISIHSHIIINNLLRRVMTHRAHRHS
jgi:hypothetical protein